MSFLDFQKILTNFVKIRPVGAELFHADGGTDRQTDRQADMTKLIVAFHNFTNAPKNSLHVGDHRVTHYSNLAADQYSVEWCYLTGEGSNCSRYWLSRLVGCECGGCT